MSQDNHLPSAFSLEKLELLARLCQSEELSPALLPITARSKDAPVPLSYTQEWVWTRCQAFPYNPFYNTTSAFILEGNLDISALESSLNEIIRRHEIWRTRFRLENNQPYQYILPEFELEVPLLDLRQHHELEAQARHLAEEQARQPFDLSGGNLLRATLLELDEQRHTLLLVVHHIIADGWSGGLFVRELATLYPAFQAGQPSPLPALPVQYADYTLWQRHWLQGETLGNLLDYWKNQLAGIRNGISLPGQKLSSGPPSFAGKTLPVTFPRPLTEALTRLSRQEGVTLFTLLLAAFKALLFYYCRNEDIVVGTPVANRSRVETETLLGCYVNLLVLRSDLSGNPTFRELVRRENKVCQDAFAHQDLPFVKLVEALQPDRENWPHPFFQVKFEYNNTPTRARLQLPDLHLRPLEFEPGTVRYDLNLILEDRRNGLGGWLQYAADLYEDTFIIRLEQNYQKLLAKITANPSSHLLELISGLDPA